MKSPQKLSFVIQKHETTRPHYDFRLEVGGTMPSWAIPKGFQNDPSEKRLAMKTEDHDLDWRKFQGTIPEGEYGAGEVSTWDEGIFIPEMEIEKGKRIQIHGIKGEDKMAEGIRKGEIKFFLIGKKIKGSYALIKTKGFPPGKKNAWLLIMHK